MRSITIIGGGASGTLLAVHLLRNSGGGPLEINIVEKRKAIGRGVAFSTEFDRHLLNVPAGKMSAFPSEPGHFHAWLAEKGHSYAAHDFVPRRLFGQYLRELLDETATRYGSFAELRLIDDEATEITVEQDTAIVKLASGLGLVSSRVVLAFGNFLPPQPSVADLRFTSDPKYVHDVWSPDAYDRIDPNDSVLIIGTGLSMVDVVLRLDSLGHRGMISAISTRGLLPAVHKLGFDYPDIYEEIASSHRITEIFTAVRRHSLLAASNGSDWRAVIDVLRPHTQKIWLGLPTNEKRYFMQHLSRYWNAARHRMPPEAAVVIDTMRGEGRLEILSGRLRHITHDGEQFLVNYDREGRLSYLHTDAIFNCIGSQTNFRSVESLLVKDLLRRGMIRCDELSLGLDATPDGVLLDAEGRPSPVLRTLGTALKGILWESTAIPEIRVQAKSLATRLLDELNRGPK